MSSPLAPLQPVPAPAPAPAPAGAPTPAPTPPLAPQPSNHPFARAPHLTPPTTPSSSSSPSPAPTHPPASTPLPRPAGPADPAATIGSSPTGSIARAAASTSASHALLRAQQLPPPTPPPQYPLPPIPSTPHRSASGSPSPAASATSGKLSPFLAPPSPAQTPATLSPAASLTLPAAPPESTRESALEGAAEQSAGARSAEELPVPPAVPTVPVADRATARSASAAEAGTTAVVTSQAPPAQLASASDAAAASTTTAREADPTNGTDAPPANGTDAPLTSSTDGGDSTLALPELTTPETGEPACDTPSTSTLPSPATPSFSPALQVGTDRRPSVASTASGVSGISGISGASAVSGRTGGGGKGSRLSGSGSSSKNSSAATLVSQRKLAMAAQHKSLGLDAEIKAQEAAAAAAPKRRSLFRSVSAASSTPDFSSLLRGKKPGGTSGNTGGANTSSTRQQSFKDTLSLVSSRDSKRSSTSRAVDPIANPVATPTAAPSAPAAGGAAPSSAPADDDDDDDNEHAKGSTPASHMSNNPSGSAGRTRERRHEPSRNEWDPYNGETARQMATIVETVAERAPSLDESGGGANAGVAGSPSSLKRGKGKGMFGRMFGGGSATSTKDHSSLASSSQISLSPRPNVELSSPPSQSSPQLPTASTFQAPSPQFAPTAQFAYEPGSTPPANGIRPPIPQRPSQRIVPKEHRSSVASVHSSHQEIVAEQQQQQPVSSSPPPPQQAQSTGPPQPPTRGHSSQASSNSVASIVEQPHAISPDQPLPPPPHPIPRDIHDGPRSRPQSRRPTDERPTARHAGSSFTDDVTGLLDRIGHVGAQGGVHGARDVDPSEHLQVSPDMNARYTAVARTPSPYTDRSPPLHHTNLSRRGTAEGQMTEPLPVPAPEAAAAGVPLPASNANTSPYDVTPVDSSEPHTRELDTTEQDDVSTGVVVVDAGTVPSDEWQQRNGTHASPSQIAIEVTGSPNQSNSNLPDIDADEERGRRLAAEFIEDDHTHVPVDRVAEFLGGPRNVNNAALRYYMQYFDMRNLKLDQAFRDLCAKLHLKAESQEIDRIIEAFSARYYDCNPNTVFGSPGVVHTVTGAMLMLNTDLHIADLQKHMSRADFVRNAMRAIQESMPTDQDAATEMTTTNDSGSLREPTDVSASQSSTSVARLRSASSRNASGTLAATPSDLTLPTPDLRSRGASSTTVNSFTYTKAWELEAENALKEIYSNVRNDCILLPMGPMGIDRQSSTSLTGFGRMAAMGVKRNSPYGANSMFSTSDGRLSPTPSYANSIGDQFQALAPALGFAGNLSHTVIREQEDEAHSVQSKETLGSMEDLDDDELALLGAPWAKEGLLHRKIQVEAQGRKPQKKDWKQYFVVIQKGDLHMFVFGAGGSSMSMGGGVVGGGNWMSNAKTSGAYSLMHAMAMALPKPGYSASRPYCFTVTFPTGEISVFQAGTEELVSEWVATCNYWAARKSRQPLVGGVSNIEYGWTRVMSLDDDDRQGDRSSLRSARSQIMRLGGINRSRSNQSSSSGLDRIQINDWKPPPHATMPSNLDEEGQLESLTAYVQSLKEELNQHKSIEEAMGRLYTPGSKNATKARENWTAKSRYIHSEIFKYETYVEVLRNTIASRIERQGQRKLERALARSTVSLHADLAASNQAAQAAQTGAAANANRNQRRDSLPTMIPMPDNMEDGYVEPEELGARARA